jgi:hypothetical protein
LPPLEPSKVSHFPELGFATSVEVHGGSVRFLNAIWRLSGREMKGTNCDVKKQFEESKNDEH